MEENLWVEYRRRRRETQDGAGGGQVMSDRSQEPRQEGAENLDLTV